MKMKIEKSFKTLDFPKVINQLSKHAVSELGKEKIHALSPSSDYIEVKDKQEETEDGVRILRMKGGIPLSPFIDIRPHLKRANIGAALNGKEVAQIGKVIKSVREIDQFFVKLKEDEIELKQLYKISDQFVALRPLERAIFTVVDEDGYVLDDASTALRGIRTGIKQTESRVRQKLESIVRGSQAKFLTDAIITMRNDRYVIPVKQENRTTFGGVVHDQSSTGQTLFIEPQSVVDLNNRLKQYQSEERSEIERILAEVTNVIMPHTAEIDQNMTVLVLLDFINAKAKYAQEIKGIKPLISENNAVSFMRARHPLLEESEVVANDIILGEEYQTMIITGPNTGGKTVALKTLGLLQLMAQSGLQIPVAEQSVMGIFSSVFADIGDEQSIEQSLSTFSSHMTNIVEILNKIDDQSLVLLDELGAGTDPQEGAALAIALLDAIAAKGSYALITSHYPELKAYGYNRPQTINASMEFDVETLSPTYKLLIGIPGRSNAFEIAKRLGLNDMVIESARQLMSGESQSVDEMIQDLENKRKQASQETGKVREELQNAQALHRELKNAFKEYEAEKEQLKKKAEKEANQIIEKAQKDTEKIIEDLRARQLQGAQGSAVKEHEFIEAQSRLSNLKLEEESLKKNKILQKQKRKKELKPGDFVQVESLGQKGTIVEKSGNKQWVVQMGMLKMKLNESDLTPAQQEKEPSYNRTSLKSTSMGSVSTEIDLRGERVEAALNQLDQYIDQAILSNYPQVTVIHGMGTGAVRKAVQDYLKKHPQVKSYNDAPANQGGNGATIVLFK
ncbi:endonuclease MutS2 [Marinilactibacillus psychrotolerans]|uniref:Endonuclease MutS2 n=1 Tax=Marinilactibacillus psychrotolerans TaxID=191770 RepID=A0AAV3WVU5_9LACT|nr:endonuclease MutS2 [Marinilactibacillus psychrotolerans]GEL67815.1 endonuclease MutS2 [Marinilactibacillus psychrotolerans]GEQ36773.1 DNA mismatch repair protein MutS [Marinilactibacillus psychrotolerans]SDD19829.1 DNA mismatch repair protein MutS2 [Marinilactibacillus psychrotolerans]